MKDLLNDLEEKYSSLNEPVDTYLKGLLHAKPITYWDYIQEDTLLTLQKPRTGIPDEMVFIMYHQINEIIFKMILWEIEQVSTNMEITPEYFTKKLDRISRYFDMLCSSFSIMGEGMEVDQYMKFRDALTPASGFQSVQYRMIELASTSIINLIDYRFRANIERNTPYEYAYEHLYWQAAGKDYKTGNKSQLLLNFEKKYKKSLIKFMEERNETNLYVKFNGLSQDIRENSDLIRAMRHYDYTVNVTWVMAHLNAAKKYLNSGEETAEATGGSNWQKYMHPKYQKRIFFPDLWSKEEFDNWGKDV